MLKFKSADPSRRTPTWLQNGTKENIIWQLKMTVLVVSVMEAYEWYQERKRMNELKPYRKS